MPLELNYSNLRGHEWMLRDSVPCEAFRRAIAEKVTPGCAVLDVGAGTGVLSLFAAQMGVRIVYAVERTGIAELARRIIRENGFGDRIQVLRDDLETVARPERVDVIVSEWLGGYALAAWFDARLSENILLSNGPGEPGTHWGRTIFPVGRVIDLAARTRLSIRFRHQPRVPANHRQPGRSRPTPTVSDRVMSRY
jgi:SAM-dependent methyltransferase